VSGRPGRRRGPDPFAALGLDARPDLTDDDVRAAWRRVAAATHPDRPDGGDPATFAAAAAAYTELRTRFGRGEAMADAQPGRRAARFRRWRAAAGAAGGGGMHARAGRRQALDGSARAGSSRRLPAAAARLAARVRRGRPARLGLRVLAAAAAGAAAWAVAGSEPAGPALITGAVTWLVLTARQDLAPPAG
jgi:curved DNA-binding protein CbpA